MVNLLYDHIVVVLAPGLVSIRLVGVVGKASKDGVVANQHVCVIALEGVVVDQVDAAEKCVL